ncbi:MAG: sulfatase [Rikenellaceae bacterium]
MKNHLPLIFTSLSAATISMSCGEGGVDDGQRPNFLLFIADDCSYYDIGCYGSSDSITPNIDKFAEEGVQFSKAYQAVAMSSPTRHSLYTSLYPVRSGAYPNHTFAKEGNLSIAHHLQAEGYKVALIGKSHVEPVEVFPFDLWIDNNKAGELDFEAVDKFIGECNENKTPYMLIVGSKQPHSPWNMGDQSLFDKESIELPPMYVDTPETREQFRNYLAEINYMDGEFGRVLGSLEENGEPDNTMVIYLSEQGNSFPFSKWTCYDVGVHSAMLIRYPKHFEAGLKSDALVEYVDVVPTILDVANIEPLSELDGESFLSVLRGKSSTHKEYTFSLQTTRGINSGSENFGIRSVANSRYRYIVNLNHTKKFACLSTKMPRDITFTSWVEAAKSDEHAARMVHNYQYREQYELYDVVADPYCMNNLYTDPKHSELVEELSSALAEWMEYCGDEGVETEARAKEHLYSNYKKMKRNETK